MAPGDLLINFELGSANLTAQARSNAKSFAEALNAPELSSHRFVLNGHTDASGSSQTNATLSQARAESVKSFLVAQGVDAKRLDAKGYGSAKPLDARHPAASVNRRVEGLRLD
jgi:outer membrane protein OmpA-like peptidoglycan-associated protein